MVSQRPQPQHVLPPLFQQQRPEHPSEHSEMNLVWIPVGTGHVRDVPLCPAFVFLAGKERSDPTCQDSLRKYSRLGGTWGNHPPLWQHQAARTNPPAWELSPQFLHFLFPHQKLLIWPQDEVQLKAGSFSRYAKVKASVLESFRRKR